MLCVICKEDVIHVLRPGCSIYRAAPTPAPCRQLGNIDHDLDCVDTAVSQHLKRLACALLPLFIRVIELRPIGDYLRQPVPLLPGVPADPCDHSPGLPAPRLPGGFLELPAMPFVYEGHWNTCLSVVSGGQPTSEHTHSRRDYLRRRAACPITRFFCPPAEAGRCRAASRGPA